MTEDTQKRLAIVMSILISIGIIAVIKKHKEHQKQKKIQSIEKEIKKFNKIFLDTEPKLYNYQGK